MNAAPVTKEDIASFPERMNAIGKRGKPYVDNGSSALRSALWELYQRRLYVSLRAALEELERMYACEDTPEFLWEGMYAFEQKTSKKKKRKKKK